jgi:hypothetical protein
MKRNARGRGDDLLGSQLYDSSACKHMCVNALEAVALAAAAGEWILQRHWHRRTCSCGESGTREMASMSPRTSFAVFALRMAPNSGRSSVRTPRRACRYGNPVRVSVNTLGSSSKVNVASGLQDAAFSQKAAALACASFCFAYRSASNHHTRWACGWISIAHCYDQLVEVVKQVAHLLPARTAERSTRC